MGRPWFHSLLKTLSNMSLMAFYFRFYMFVFLFCLTLLHIGTHSLPGNETDRMALLAFKSSINHDTFGSLSSWNDSHHFCDWEGVTCGRKHRRVTAIDLMSQGLVGSLSPHLGNLSFLKALNLINNSIQGEVPQDLGRLFRLQVLYLDNNTLAGKIPTNLSFCTNLKYLRLGNNKLTGKIPEKFELLSNLKILIIHRNNLVGGIPVFLGNLTSLEVISASKNAFGGSIPDSLSRLSKLSTLILGGNNLSGTIPPSIYNLSLLSIFSVSENSLHGNLPQSIGHIFPHLIWFQVSDNFFSGVVPVSFSNASKLEVFDIGYNYFSEQLSISFGGMRDLWFLSLNSNNLGSGDTDEMSFLHSLVNCSNLQRLGFSNNQFIGTIPSSIANLSTKLEIMVMAYNQLYGSIPQGICNLYNLSVLGMEGNRFTGQIPTEIDKLQKLKGMSLSDNKLSGKIPFSLGNLSSLIELELNNNKLQGTIPSALGKCKKLLSLDLSQNDLIGTIPKQILNMPDLSISLNLSRNYLVGFIPSDVGNLTTLTALDVSENNLSGEIPRELGQCSHLETLHMEGNFLHGSIPYSLSSLRGIRIIDLSRNNLSGKIPKYLETFHLEMLNLSNNNFQGELPTKGVFTNTSGISVAGNNGLCGGISQLQLPKCIISSSKTKKLSSSHKILISVASLIFGVIMVTSLVLCWSKKKRTIVEESLGSFFRNSFVQVAYEKLLKATNGFSSANLIGIGSFGSVYKGLLGQDEQIVAIKVLNLQHEAATKSFKAECNALRNIRHRNLVKIITSCSSIDRQGRDFKALIYEYMPNGSLDKWLHPVPELDEQQVEYQNLTFLQRTCIAIDVACALDYLHHHSHKPIIHCDLKPSNALLDSDMVAHVGDFGIAKFLPQISSSDQSSSVGVRGTIGYTALEYGTGSEVSMKGDIYSFGIMLLEMMTGKKPTDSMFDGGLNLHNYARMALLQHNLDVVDPIILHDDDDEETTRSIQRRQMREARHAKTRECIISMIKIGVECSTDSVQDRMEISVVLHELQLVKNILLEPRTRIN